MHEQSDQDEELWEVIDEVHLEQLIRDFIALGREFLKILRYLIDVEESDEHSTDI